MDHMDPVPSVPMHRSNRSLSRCSSLRHKGCRRQSRSKGAPRSGRRSSSLCRRRNAQPQNHGLPRRTRGHRHKHRARHRTGQHTRGRRPDIRGLHKKVRSNYDRRPDIRGPHSRERNNCVRRPNMSGRNECPPEDLSPPRCASAAVGPTNRRTAPRATAGTADLFNTVCINRFIGASNHSAKVMASDAPIASK